MACSALYNYIIQKKIPVRLKFRLKKIPQETEQMETAYPSLLPLEIKLDMARAMTDNDDDYQCAALLASAILLDAARVHFRPLQAPASTCSTFPPSTRRVGWPTHCVPL